jgi:membrane-bound lytic murein transglycosylase A
MTQDAKPTTPATTPAPAEAPEAKLEAATFADLPGWQGDDHLAAFKTFLKSCDCVIKAAGKPVTKAAVPSKVAQTDLATACRAAQAVKPPTKASAKAFFETHFVPHRIVQKNPHGLLTGYYEPVLEGSRTAEGKFHTPVYKRPPDLVNVVAEADRASKPDGLTHVRKTSTGEEVPFPTRAEIEQGALAGKGLELLYLEDPVEVFFMHIQGSGRIHLTDGTTVRINYDGKNGHPYSSIGRYLIDTGLLAANKVSMQALGKWLRADKARGQQVMWQNKSFIFFRELDDSEGPMGAMSVALTPGRSLAVDTGFHTLGTPLYVSAPELAHATKDGGFNRLMVAQDVGSAIKGPERGDIYFGSGEKAGKLAGVTKHQGNFFVLLPTSAATVGQGTIRFGESLQWETTAKAAP